MESGGMSGMRTSYDLGTEGYSLEMVTYLDGRTACILWTPNSFNNREAELANSEPMFGPRSQDNNVMHAKSGLRVKINRPDSVIADVILLATDWLEVLLCRNLGLGRVSFF